jgi:4-diphosphocytidyl-2-C-methyl-D-erythritol kinase
MKPTIGVRSARVRSLAKINLDLRVLNKRPDGFHELRTVFQTVSLADTLDIAFEPARKTSLTIDDSLNIADNLVLRAAEAALDEMKVSGRVHFKLRKQIPMGAGMGGGSSNAASILLALPVLAGKQIGYEKLLTLGAALGSDVPFFLTGGTAVAVDRGAELYSLPDIAEEPILVVACGLHVATGAAYQALGRGLTLPASSRIINSFQLFVRTLGDSRSARAASALSANDFEPVLLNQHPQLHALFQRLRGVCHAPAAGTSARRKPNEAAVRMTGSGSALFALFGSTAERDLAGRSMESILEGDREFAGSRVIRAKLVSQRSYQRLWRGQLAGHILRTAGKPAAIPGEATWPSQGKYVR